MFIDHTWSCLVQGIMWFILCWVLNFHRYVEEFRLVVAKDWYLMSPSPQVDLWLYKRDDETLSRKISHHGLQGTSWTMHVIYEKDWSFSVIIDPSHYSESNSRTNKTITSSSLSVIEKQFEVLNVVSFRNCCTHIHSETWELEEVTRDSLCDFSWNIQKFWTNMINQSRTHWSQSWSGQRYCISNYLFALNVSVNMFSRTCGFFVLFCRTYFFMISAFLMRFTRAYEYKFAHHKSMIYFRLPSSIKDHVFRIFLHIGNTEGRWFHKLFFQRLELFNFTWVQDTVCENVSVSSTARLHQTL